MDDDPVSEEACFQGIENPGVENDGGVNDYLDGTFTNMSNQDAQLVVTLACSDTPQ